MAKYCDSIFGDLLLKDPLPDFPVSFATILTLLIYNEEGDIAYFEEEAD